MNVLTISHIDADEDQYDEYISKAMTVNGPFEVEAPHYVRKIEFAIEKFFSKFFQLRNSIIIT
jgi:hypothetical protein